jgi:hypothetical protein
VPPWSPIRCRRLEIPWVLAELHKADAQSDEALVSRLWLGSPLTVSRNYANVSASWADRTGAIPVSRIFFSHGSTDCASAIGLAQPWPT